MEDGNLYNGYLYCDFDGTFINTDIEKVFIAYLLKSKRFRLIHYILASASIFLNKICQGFGYGGVLKSWSAFRKVGETSQMIHEFIIEKGKQIQTVEVVLQRLLEYKRQGYKIILLTASDERLVLEFLDYKKYRAVFDQVIGCQLYENQIIVKSMPYGRNKCRFLKTENNIGIANEYADRFYLLLCEHAIVHTTDKRLLKLSIEKGWERV